MDALIVTSFIIPAIVAFVLIALLIKERYNLLPKQNRRSVKANNFSSTTQNSSNNYGYYRSGSKDYLDFSGGTMGI
jgi:hypothetical protein